LRLASDNQQFMRPVIVNTPRLCKTCFGYKHSYHLPGS